MNTDWQPLSMAQVACLFASFPGSWWLAGGYAIELFVGAPFRAHSDIDVLVLRANSADVHRTLGGWDVWMADPPGSLRPWPPGDDLPTRAHDVWCRERPDGPWRLQVMIDESDGEYWVSRRDARIRRPLTKIGHVTPTGVPFLAPEIQLYYKSRKPRPRDEQDLAMALPHLSAAQRAWLAEAVELANPEHPWLAGLGEN